MTTPAKLLIGIGLRVEIAKEIASSYHEEEEEDLDSLLETTRAFMVERTESSDYRTLDYVQQSIALGMDNDFVEVMEADVGKGDWRLWTRDVIHWASEAISANAYKLMIDQRNEKTQGDSGDQANPSVNCNESTNDMLNPGFALKDPSKKSATTTGKAKTRYRTGSHKTSWTMTPCLWEIILPDSAIFPKETGSLILDSIKKPTNTTPPPTNDRLDTRRSRFLL